MSVHDLLEALVPLAHRMACLNAALGVCLGSWEFTCVSGMGLVEVRKSDLLCAPLAAGEDRKIAQDLAVALAAPAVAW